MDLKQVNQGNMIHGRNEFTAVYGYSVNALQLLLLQLKGTTIEQVRAFKFLGVSINDTFT